MMKRSFRDAWTAKLRSGEYIQAKYALARVEDTTRRCCLGVAYDPYDKPIPKRLFTNEFRGFPAEEDLATWGLAEYVADRLANMNDDGKSFAQIADYIDTLEVEEG